MKPPSTDLYFEAHVTIAPVFDEKREQAASIATMNTFRLAELLMVKDGAEAVSNKDTFMSARSHDFETLAFHTKEVVGALRRWGFTVRRYKIENTLVDSKHDDEFGLL